MLKLLALEPARRDQLVQETGWGIDETHATLERLRQAGKVTYWNGAQGRWFMLAPPARALVAANYSELQELREAA